MPLRYLPARANKAFPMCGNAAVRRTILLVVMRRVDLEEMGTHVTLSDFDSRSHLDGDLREDISSVAGRQRDANRQHKFACLQALPGVGVFLSHRSCMSYLSISSILSLERLVNR
jgi:hypothetical protein